MNDFICKWFGHKYISADDYLWLLQKHIKSVEHLKRVQVECIRCGYKFPSKLEDKKGNL